MSNDADLEYGPTPEHSTYEHTDIEPTIAGRFALWLVISMVISVAIVYGTFWLFENQEKSANQARQMFPLAAGQDRQPPGPQLQRQPFKDLHELRQSERDRLTSFGWVDQGSGVVRIPIEDALRLLSERGGVHALPQMSTGVNQYVQDSSSGRTIAVMATDERTRAPSATGSSSTPTTPTGTKH
jgi:hypothetical protein